MKRKFAPWKLNVCAMLLESCYKVRPDFIWQMLEPRAEVDTSILKLSYQGVTVEAPVNLRTIWKEGKRHVFTTCSTLIAKLLMEYYDACERLRKQSEVTQ